MFNLKTVLIVGTCSVLAFSISGCGGSSISTASVVNRSFESKATTGFGSSYEDVVMADMDDIDNYESGTPLYPSYSSTTADIINVQQKFIITKSVTRHKKVV